jgi:predicted GTPase
MSRWRIAVVAGLITMPILAWAAVGTYYLWIRGWGFYAWWPLMGLVALGYFLAWYWQRKKQLLRPPDFEVPPYWTQRDRDAYKLVEARATAGEKLSPEQLSEVNFYLQTAQDLAKELAAFYRPGTSDPTDNLTVPEVLAVVELAAHDLGELVDQHLPGGHLLTIRDWKRARKLQDWYRTGSNIWWAVSALFNPLETGMRYAASQAGLSTPLKLLQENLYLWFYTAFIQRLGNYLIDLNSGRLRVGASRYRELLARMRAEEERAATTMEKQAAGPFPASRAAEDPVDRVGQVTITLVGQVKAGKSSLVNALLGEERARTGVVPTTEGIDRYELLTPGIPTKLTLQDTVGYGHSGPRADQVKVTAEAVKSSDLVFLVLHSRNPARQADLDMLTGLRAWFAERPDLKPPPVIGVLTHIDLLSPSMEWKPPYDWVSGTRPKEVNIREAVAAAREQLGDHLVAVVPVCASPGKMFGIDEALLPAVANWLDEVHGVAFLRALKAEADRDRMRRVFQQMLATGKLAAQRLLEVLTRV